MNGAVQVDSAPGRTVFSLALPQAQTAAPEPFSREKAISAGT